MSSSELRASLPPSSFYSIQTDETLLPSYPVEDITKQSESSPPPSYGQKCGGSFAARDKLPATCSQNMPWLQFPGIWRIGIQAPFLMDVISQSRVPEAVW
jgi:hypothetical protein